MRFIREKITLLLKILEEEEVSLLLINRDKNNPHIYYVDEHLDSYYVVEHNEVPDRDTFDLLVQRIRELHEKDILYVRVEELIPNSHSIIWGEDKDEEAISSLIQVLSILEKHSVDEIDLHPEQSLICLRAEREKFDINLPRNAFNSVYNTIEAMYHVGVFDIPVYVEEEEGKWRRIIKTC